MKEKKAKHTANTPKPKRVKRKTEQRKKRARHSRTRANVKFLTADARENSHARKRNCTK